MPRRSAVIAALGTLFLGLALAGCSSTVSLQPSPEANDPACADVIVRLPDTVDGQERRWTDAQGTAAWGDPASVVLTCGLEPLAPTTLPCQSVNGVDWVIDESDAPRYRVTSFGRTPAVEIYLDNEQVSSAQVLDTLSLAASVLPENGRVCTDGSTVG